MICVFSDISSPRLKYILKVIFNSIFKIEFVLTHNVEDFEQSTLPKVNYSHLSFKGVIQIIPSGFLNQTKITPIDVQVDWVNEIPFFFKTKNSKYDILASSFYMVSRYEEYLPFTPDAHGRFSAVSSLAFQQGFLHLPIVHLWADVLKQEIIKRYPFVPFPEQSPSFLNSLDIDVAYAYRGKPKWKFVMSFLKNVVFFDKEEIKNKINFIRTGDDVYDTYDLIEKRSDVDCVYFFLLGKPSKYDLNINANHKAIQNLIKRLNLSNKVGIHPSYRSNTKKELLSEIKVLKNITHQTVACSRQHFLKLSFPKTYEALISYNIKVDYTMGFADAVGFRAGMCISYPFYNLEEEEERPLQIVPFMVMDGTLKTYLELKPEEAIDLTKALICEVKKVNGLFVSLWHNSSLGETHGWKGWLKVYQETLKAMK